MKTYTMQHTCAFSSPLKPTIAMCQWNIAGLRDGFLATVINLYYIIAPSERPKISNTPSFSTHPF